VILLLPSLPTAGVSGPKVYYESVDSEHFLIANLLRQREEWIRFSYSNEDTKDEERRRAGVVDRRLNVVPSAKRTLSRDTPQR
jgi:hypothetical protein